MDKMYSFSEIGLVPIRISNVQSRKDVDPFDEDKKLPIFVAPMTCLLDSDNFSSFLSSKVIPIYPVYAKDTRDESILNQPYWISVTLAEFKNWFIDNTTPITSCKVLIDCANGHMAKLYDYVRQAKEKYGDKLTIMIGNIANPWTYWVCCEAGVDYVRIGIGGGSGCTTSVQTGFHTSLPWMLEKIKEIKQLYREECMAEQLPTFFTKIVADGGINTVDKAIKALALGADYVMMGSMFSKCVESCGDSTYVDGKLNKAYYGQSSIEGQNDRFGYVKNHPEGVSKLVEVTTDLSTFCDEFEAVLRSAMSYAGAFSLNEFIGRIDYEIQSQAEFKKYIK